MKINNLLAISTLILSSNTQAFTDIEVGHPNNEAIQYVKEQNIVGGYADNTFKPDNAINRAEFTKIIIGSTFSEAERGACLTLSGNEIFPDVKASDWFGSYVCLAKMKGIIKGYEDGTFQPAKNISFVEAAKIIVMSFDFETTQTSNVWYEPFVRVLESKKSIPETIKEVGKDVTRGEMAEMIFRLKTLNQNTTTPEPSTSKISNNTIYKNGTFSVVETFESPGGTEIMTVEIRLKNDIVTSVQVKSQTVTSIGMGLISLFNNAVQDLVLQKKLNEIIIPDNVKIDTYTPPAFKSALDKLTHKAERD